MLRRNGVQSGDELGGLYTELVRTSCLYGGPGLALEDVEAGVGSVRDGARRFENLSGKENLRRLLAYDAANAASAEMRADALVRLADLDLVFAEGRAARRSALATYRAAYGELEQSGAPRASIETIFSPAAPVALPTFVASPLATEPTAGSDRYLDVAFEIDEFGASRRIEIVGGADGVTEAERKNLVRTIARTPFRPHVEVGRVVEEAPVRVRYYLGGP